MDVLTFLYLILHILLSLTKKNVLVFRVKLCLLNLMSKFFKDVKEQEKSSSKEI